MAEKVGVAIVGCGTMGKTHARLLATFEDAALKVLVDTNEAAALGLQQEVGAASVASDLHRALEDPAVDVVLICTHHHQHAPMCTLAAQAGKHVFCEKPLAITAADCEEIQSAVEAAGIKFMVGFQARFSPFVLKLKEMAPKPWVTIAQLFDPKWGEQLWVNDPVEGGGNVLSQGCHCFDATCFLNGGDAGIHLRGRRELPPPVAADHGCGGVFAAISGRGYCQCDDRRCRQTRVNGQVGLPGLCGGCYRVAVQLLLGAGDPTVGRRAEAVDNGRPAGV